MIYNSKLDILGHFGVLPLYDDCTSVSISTSEGSYIFPPLKGQKRALMPLVENYSISGCVQRVSVADLPCLPYCSPQIPLCVQTADLSWLFAKLAWPLICGLPVQQS